MDASKVKFSLSRVEGIVVLVELFGGKKAKATRTKWSRLTLVLGNRVENFGQIIIWN